MGVAPPSLGAVQWAVLLTPQWGDGWSWGPVLGSHPWGCCGFKDCLKPGKQAPVADCVNDMQPKLCAGGFPGEQAGSHRQLVVASVQWLGW